MYSANPPVSLEKVEGEIVVGDRLIEWVVCIENNFSREWKLMFI